MACKNICKLCKRLIISQAVTYDSGVLTVNLPAGSYADGEKYCIVIAQAIPDTAIVNAPVVFTIGTGTAIYPLNTRCCRQVVAAALRTRTKYATRVVTTASGGSFNLLGNVCMDTVTTLDAIS